MDDLAEIYQRHARALFVYARSLTRNTAEAEDLVSEAFVRAVSRRSAIHDTTVRGYLITTVRHLFLNGLRRSGREAALDHELTAEAPDADRVLDSQLRAGRAQTALADLNPGERQALVLRVQDELSYEQIGTALGVTAVAAKMRVSRARARLTSTLKDKETPREARN